MDGRGDEHLGGHRLAQGGQPGRIGVVGKGEADDVEADRGEEGEGGVLLQGRAEGPGAGDVAFDDLAVALAAVGAQREPGGEGAQPVGVLRGEVDEVGVFAEGAEVGGGVLEDAGLQVASAGELDGAVVGDVEPLVQVDADGVGGVEARGEVGVVRGERGEGAEGGVGVQPEVVARAEGGDGGEVVEVDGVDGARVGDDHRRAGGVGQRPVEGCRVDGLAAGQGRYAYEGAAAEAEEGEGLGDGGVRGAGEDADRAEGRGAVLGRGHAEALAEPFAGDGEAGGVGHGGAADEGAGVGVGEAEELAQPAHGLAFQVLAAAVHRGVGVLVVGGGEPVPGERRGVAPPVTKPR